MSAATTIVATATNGRRSAGEPVAGPVADDDVEDIVLEVPDLLVAVVEVVGVLLDVIVEELVLGCDEDEAVVAVVVVSVEELLLLSVVELEEVEAVELVEEVVVDSVVAEVDDELVEVFMAVEVVVLVEVVEEAELVEVVVVVVVDACPVTTTVPTMKACIEQ